MRFLTSLLLSIFLATSAYSQTPNELKETVDALSKLDRVSGTDGCRAAMTYLKDRLTKLNYEVELQGFTYKRWEAHNILATKKAPLDTVLVVGAHYDAVAGTPGADDNASGVAGLLALAQMLQTRTTRHIISFQLYAGEEQGLIGSEFYCSHPKWPLDKHVFMLNLDMIGYLKTNGLITAPKPPVDNILRVLFEKYSFAQGITLRDDPGSDNGSFQNRGIPVAFLHTGLHANYHKKSDTSDKLNYKGMGEVCKYAFDLIQALDRYDTPNYSVLKTRPVAQYSVLLKDLPVTKIPQ
jgi:Zn-dependent M28 family amino/carboxypeptidase